MNRGALLFLMNFTIAYLRKKRHDRVHQAKEVVIEYEWVSGGSDVFPEQAAFS